MAQTIKLYTTEHLELVNITAEIQKHLTESKIKNGLVNVFTPHATTGIIINEDEPGLKQDIINKLRELVPQRAGYQHDRIDDNAHSHMLMVNNVFNAFATPAGLFLKLLEVVALPSLPG
ncbi:MAG: secondary thiamine-phosphate synthase enzyme YjbQ [DPANN group archaeon]|nr:secondary thiamine-phosphate synthase enzyme YjbQ [DPANN group archaeon]